jgi:hypothetical protein
MTIEITEAQRALLNEALLFIADAARGMHSLHKNGGSTAVDATSDLILLASRHPHKEWDALLDAFGYRGGQDE